MDRPEYCDGCGEDAPIVVSDEESGIGFCARCAQYTDAFDRDEREERAGPWRSGYGEYPMADEVYDLTHESEPDCGDPYDD